MTDEERAKLTEDLRSVVALLDGAFLTLNEEDVASARQELIAVVAKLRREKDGYS